MKELQQCNIQHFNTNSYLKFNNTNTYPKNNLEQQINLDLKFNFLGNKHVYKWAKPQSNTFTIKSWTVTNTRGNKGLRRGAWSLLANSRVERYNRDPNEQHQHDGGKKWRRQSAAYVAAEFIEGVAHFVPSHVQVPF